MGNLPLNRELDRSSIVDIVAYDLLVDLTSGARTFTSRSEIRFRCEQAGSAAYADLQAAGIRRAELNGTTLDVPKAYQPGRLELPQLAPESTLIVEAEFGYVSGGAGLHRITGPDGRDCVYSKTYPGGAPRACGRSRRPIRSRLTCPASAQGHSRGKCSLGSVTGVARCRSASMPSHPPPPC